MRSRFWLASTALLSASSAGAIEHAQLVESWHAIPDQELAEMRGGLDLGSLIANFAIERLVRINGEVVARTQLVLSELGNLSNGGLPSIELAGNIASLIQVGENNAVVQATETAQTAANQAAADSIAAQATAAAAAAAAQAAAQQAAAAASAPAGGSDNSGAASQGGAGSVASVNYAAGAGGLFGPGLAMAVAAANGELPGQAESNAANAAANASASAAANASAAGRVGTSGLAGASASGSSPAPAPATAAAASTGGSASTAAASATAGSGTAGSGTAGSGTAGSGTAGPGAAQPSGAPTLGTITVPVGNTGRTIVINNLPNAAALTTTIQNSVEAVRIDTETSISATMSSLAALRSSNFAAMLQQQAIDSVRR